jgi:hypothetical protein
MRIDCDGAASSLRARHGTVRAASRDREPQTHIDEQPAGSVPYGCEEFVLARFVSDARCCRGGAAKFGDTVSRQCLEKSGV